MKSQQSIETQQPIVTLQMKARPVLDQKEKELIARRELFEKNYNKTPHLVVILVGDDPASAVYVKNKESACHRMGLKSTKIVLPQNSTGPELADLISKLNQDDDVDGILLQMPLPPHLKGREFIEMIHPSKDVDGLTSFSQGCLMTHRPAALPCTPKGVISILDFYKQPISGKSAVVVGRSQIVGRPMALLLEERGATVTVCHSKTPNISDYTQKADIVVVAAGKKKLLGKKDFKKGAVIVDVGIHRLEETQKLCGDVDADGLEGYAEAFTPVPGGVGPMTIMSLLENVLELAEANEKK
jgi:methylenetetrahydrofolate dehydrogenase (NADP+)/methenyltetrahydrofolate cyclohydrolase